MARAKAIRREVQSDGVAAPVPQPPLQADPKGVTHGSDGKGATSGGPGEDVGLQEREEMIRQAAYECYRQRGGRHGSALDDWLQAEAAIDRPGPQTDEKREKP